MANRVICVLGMHRSGTSCLTGTLEQAGVHLGEVSTQKANNAKGNRENVAIRRLNDQVLKDNGGSWLEPPGKVVWSAEHRRVRDDVLAGFARHATWGFKDPRTVLTFDGWLEALPSATLVGIFRHPLAVARSLHARNEMPLEKGLALWTAYNQRLQAIRARYPVPLLCFDEPAEAFQDKLTRVLAKLGLHAGSGFFDPELRHQEATDEAALPKATQALYEDLLAAAL